jgi:beta-N-acetylhexosaminidase
MVLHCNGEMPEMRAVAAAAPVLAGEAARRAAAALAMRKPAAPVDLAARRAEFENLMAGVSQGARGLA